MYTIPRTCSGVGQVWSDLQHWQNPTPWASTPYQKTHLAHSPVMTALFFQESPESRLQAKGTVQAAAGCSMLPGSQDFSLQDGVLHSCTGQGSWGPHPQLLTWRLGAHCLAGDSLLSLRLRGPWEREQLWASCIDCSNSCCSQLPLSLGHSKTGRDPISCIYAEQAVMLQRQHLYCTPPASMGNLHMYHSWRLQKAKTQGPLTVSWELRLHLLPWRV